jgi:hypothetical protein
MERGSREIVREEEIAGARIRLVPVCDRVVYNAYSRRFFISQAIVRVMEFGGGWKKVAIPALCFHH